MQTLMRPHDTEVASKDPIGDAMHAANWEGVPVFTSFGSAKRKCLDAKEDANMDAYRAYSV